MPTAYIDRIDTLNLVERLGVVRSLTRKARVTFDRTAETPSDFSILGAALDALPAPNTPFSLITPADGYLDSRYLKFDALVLVERRADLIDQEKYAVDVTLQYEHLAAGPNQALVAGDEQQYPNRRGLIFGKGRCSVQEKTTNFYRYRGQGDRIQILTGHTFPQWDTGVVAMLLDPQYPMTVVQGGEVTIPFPSANFQIQGVMTTSDPWRVADQFIAHINGVPWLGHEPYYWLCSEVGWEVLDPAGVTDDMGFVQSSYQFTFEFQYNFDKWDPTVAFNDQRTGRPPAGVVQGNIADANGTLRFTRNSYLDRQAALLNAAALAALGTPNAAAAAVAAAAAQAAANVQVPALPLADFNRLFRVNFIE